MNRSKEIIISLAIALIMLPALSFAAPYQFNGTWIDVEAWTGAGANETILVVDWNRLDNFEATLSESHAFGYRWDGVKYEADMLQDFNDAGILTVTTGYGGGFVMNIGYTDAGDGESHLHTEEGSWNLASTSDPNAYWGGWGDPATGWNFNTAGTEAELLVDGQYEGINAIMYFGSLPTYADNQLDIPLAAPVPVPAAALLLGSGLIGLIGLRRRGSK